MTITHIAAGIAVISNALKAMTLHASDVTVELGKVYIAGIDAMNQEILAAQNIQQLLAIKAKQDALKAKAMWLLQLQDFLKDQMNH